MADYLAIQMWIKYQTAKDHLAGEYSYEQVEVLGIGDRVCYTFGVTLICGIIQNHPMIHI